MKEELDPEVAPSKLPVVTPAEMRVLELTAFGLMSREIAARNGVTRQAVKIRAICKRDQLFLKRTYCQIAKNTPNGAAYINIVALVSTPSARANPAPRAYQRLVGSRHNARSRHVKTANQQVTT